MTSDFSGDLLSSNVQPVIVTSRAEVRYTAPLTALPPVKDVFSISTGPSPVAYTNAPLPSGTFASFMTAFLI